MPAQPAQHIKPVHSRHFEIQEQEGWQWLGFGLAGVDGVRELKPIEGARTLLDIRKAGPDDAAEVSFFFKALERHMTSAPIFWIQAAIKQCDYDRALARARLAADYSFMPGFYRNMAGVILLWAGRYEEARETFQQSIGETRQEGMGAGSAALENIGCALAWQGRYAEAIKMFEGSIAISQSQVMVYSDLAEAYVRQGTELPRALELTDRALKTYYLQKDGEPEYHLVNEPFDYDRVKV